MKSRFSGSGRAYNRRPRKDASEAGIVDALRRIGAAVEILGLPVDLLVSYANRTMLVEVKTPGKEKRRTPKQAAFIAAWPGELHVCSDPEEAIRAVTGPYAYLPSASRIALAHSSPES